LPSLAERREDLQPNIEYELLRYQQVTGDKVSFNKEAQAQFLKFAELPSTLWRGNFRDLNAAITRMATLAPSGRIRAVEVEAEQRRLTESWVRSSSVDQSAILTDYLSEAEVAEVDPFDRPQLANVIKVCKESKSLSEAGRALFAVSRQQRKTTNDGDRLRKYLAKFELKFELL